MNPIYEEKLLLFQLDYAGHYALLSSTYRHTLARPSIIMAMVLFNSLFITGRQALHVPNTDKGKRVGQVTHAHCPLYTWLPCRTMGVTWWEGCVGGVGALTSNTRFSKQLCTATDSAIAACLLGTMNEKKKVSFTARDWLVVGVLDPCYIWGHIRMWLIG